MPQVVVDLGSGGTGRLSKLLTGECDVLAWPAASQLTILRDDPRLRLTLRPGMNIAYLAFNTDKPPLNNPAVRHALALSINNQRLMQSIYYGTAETAASILPRASWAYDNEAKITEYNPAKSREQLKALGLENLTLQLWITRQQCQQIANGWRGQLAIAVDNIVKPERTRQMIVDFYRHFDDVELLVFQEVFNGVWDALSDGRVELAIGATQAIPVGGRYTFRDMGMLRDRKSVV